MYCSSRWYGPIRDYVWREQTNGINIVVEAVTCLVFFDSLDNRAASLPDVKVVAIFTGYLVYCVARAMLRSRRLVGVEYGHQRGWRGKGGREVVT